MSKEATNPRRPVLRYHGGKWMIAPWIISHFPEHDIYVEPFGGAGSVLMRKPRSKGEVYNDLNSEVVNVFRILRDPPRAEELKRLIELTPYSREEFDLSYDHTDDPMESARRTVAKSYMAFGTTSQKKKGSGFRSTIYAHNSTGATDWVTYPEAIGAFTARLAGVVIENRKAVDLMLQHDSLNTLFYCDPPYLKSVRSSLFQGGTSRGDRAYKHDMLDEESHAEFAEVVNAVKGGAIVSGYQSELYNDVFFKGWRRVETQGRCDGAKKRIECLWIKDAGQTFENGPFRYGLFSSLTT